MEDWERAYEEDRRRVAMGHDIDGVKRRGVDGDANPFAEQKKSSLPPDELSPAMFASDKSPRETTGTDAITTAVASVPVVAVAPLHPDGETAPWGKGEREEEEEEREKEREREEEKKDDGGAEETEGGALQDPRFGLRCLAPGWNMHLLFGTKFGRHLFFAEALHTTFKGFLSSKETLVGCFVTPNCVYLGDVVTGALIVCLDIKGLFEIYNFSGVAVGLRARDATELHLQTRQHTSRFISVLSAIASHWGADVRTISADATREQLFRKEMQLLDKSRHAWALVEDPRTGLRVLCVTEPYANVALAPVAEKILHWFGGVHQYVRDWIGARTRKRRIAWVTATCLFVARAEGPGSDGRGIRHCVAAEYVTELIFGPGAALGICAADGPPQPPFVVFFDTQEDRRAVAEALQQCYAFRKEPRGGAIRISHTENIEERFGGQVTAEGQPHLFLMRTRKELYNFLRSPTKKKT